MDFRMALVVLAALVAACSGEDFASTQEDGGLAGTGSGAGGAQEAGAGGMSGSGPDGGPDAATTGGSSGQSGSGGQAGLPGQDGGDSGQDAGGDGASGSGGIGSGGAGGATSGGAGGLAGGASGTGGATDSGIGGAGGAAGDACVPQPCANDGQTCGQIPNGCGGLSTCLHQCAAPETCGAAQPNKCGCVEYTSQEIAAMCAGKCGGTVQFKCTPNQIGCEQISGEYCLDSYTYCDPSTNACGGCTRKYIPGSMGGCPTASVRPFEYVCPAQFDNGIQDSGETDVDCGGPYAPARCAVGDSCTQNSDCASKACASGTCANTSFGEPTCEIGMQGDWCCPKSVDGCVRVPTMDSDPNYCGGNGYGFLCDSGPAPSPTCQVPAIGGGTISGTWCCPSIFP